LKSTVSSATSVYNATSSSPDWLQSVRSGTNKVIWREAIWISQGTGFGDNETKYSD